MNTWRAVKPSANAPWRVVTGDKGDASGVEVEFIKSRQEFSIGGWYDSCVGIQSVTVGLGDFLRALGVTEAMVQKALKRESGPK